MGGFGSGRPGGFRRNTVESCRSIDVNRLHQEGCLEPGWRGSWQWTRDGEKVASITLRTENDLLRLSCRVRIGGGEWEDVEENPETARRVREDHENWIPVCYERSLANLGDELVDHLKNLAREGLGRG